MRLCLSVWCVCVAVIAAPSAAAAEIAVLPIKGENGADNVTITELVRQSVVGFGLDVLSSSDTDVVIADSAAFSGTCDTSTSACALQLGGVAGVRRVITGKITATQAQLHLYDVASQAEVDSSFVGIGNDAGGAARLAAVRLLRPDLEMGGLHVSVDVAGASIVVDGVERGSSPSVTVSLKPGRHEVYVTHVDFESQTFSVDVDFGVATHLNVTLDTKKARAPTAPTSSDDGGAESDVGLSRVFVLDVVASGAGPLALSLATTAAVEQLQCLDGLLVVSPQDLAALAADSTAQRLSSCRSDACWTEALLEAFGPGEVILIDADRSGGGPVSGRRYNLETGILGANMGAVGPSDAELIAGVRLMARGLYPDLKPRSEVGCGEGQAQRLVPPPLSTTIFGVSAVATGAATVAAGVALLMAVTSTDENIGPGLQSVAITTGVAAGAGAIITACEVPFVDWGDMAGQNDALVQDSVRRKVTRRLGPGAGGSATTPISP